jgi:hypothetical protein
MHYSEAGLRKRAEWERTGDLQHREDPVDAETSDESERRRRKTAEIGDIPVPPKYCYAAQGDTPASVCSSSPARFFPHSLQRIAGITRAW